ncbi:MAG: FtsX-like permease family protein [Erysipelotrichaceae bacterium]
MFNKDTFRLIKKTFNRFFTIVCIVIIGVAFMMGLLSSSLVMKESVEKYYDENNLQDVQIYSSYGFCQEDIDEIEKIEGIDLVYPSKFKDVYSRFNSQSDVVLRIRELDSQVNKYQLIAGREPQKDDEVLVLNRGNLQIGDEIEVYLIDDEITDYLAVTKFKVVGIVDSCEYMSKFLSTSLLDNLDLSNVVYCANSNFVFEYYTSVYCTFKDTKALNSFKEEYQQAIDNGKSEIEYLASKQQDYLKDQLLVDYQKEIDEGKQTLEEERVKGQQLLDESKDQLDEALIKIIIGEMEIETNQSTIEYNETLLLEKEKLVNDSLQQVNEAIAQIEQESGSSFDEVYQQVESSYQLYQLIKNMRDNPVIDDSNIQILIEQNEKLQQEIDDLNQQLAEKQQQLELINRQIENETNPVVLQQLKQQKLQLSQEISLIESQIALKQALIETNNLIINQSAETQQQYQQYLQEILDKIDESANGSIEQTYIQMTQLKQGKEQLESALIEIENGKKELAEGKEQLNQAKQLMASYRSQYESGLKQYNQAVIDFNLEIEKAENKLKLAQQKLDELPQASWTILDRDMQYSCYMFSASADQMNSIGIVFPVLFYLVAALVCVTTMTRLIDEQRGQIGIFRALGFTKGQIIGKYVIYALTASVVGSAIGLVVGMMIFPTVIYETWRIMYYFPDMIKLFPIKNAIISFVSFSLLMSIVAALVTNSSLKQPPSQLMRPKPPKSAKKILLEKIDFIWQKFSFTDKITVRNIVRYKSRFFMTVIGIAGCTSLLVLGFGLKDSISDIVTVQYSDYFNYNCNVYLDNDNNIDEIVEVLENDLDNQQVVKLSTYNASVYGSFGDDVITAEVLDPRKGNEIFNLYDYKTGEKMKMDNKGVIISEKFAENNKLKVGDKITITSSEGIKAEVEISGICKMYFQHYLFISDSLYSDLFEENVHYSLIAVRNQAGYTALQEDLQNVENIASITDFSGFIANFNAMIEALDYVIIVIIVTAGSLAFVVLTNLMQVNISERIREIATLKVLGFRNGEVNRYIFKEIVLLTLIGIVCGLPLGKIEEKFVLKIIDMDNVMFTCNIKPLTYVIAAVITPVFTIIVLQLTKKSLRNVEMVESLKSVE